MRYFSILLAAASLVLVAGCQAPAPVVAQPEVEVEFLLSEGAAVRDLPFSEVVRVGDLLFLSGQIGMDPESGSLPSGGIGPETRQTLENIKNTVEKHGSSMDRVFKCTVMLADISEWAAMNEVYVTFFPGNKPARSAFGASGLAMGARVEIECLATLP